MLNLDFELVTPSLANSFSLFLMFEGGDADTEHPEEHGIVIEKEGELIEITAFNYQSYLEEIEKEVDQYKTLKRILDVNDILHTTNYKEIEEHYGEEVMLLYDNAPNDPQTDYQTKCSLDSIKLVMYDANGNRYESYT